MRNSEKMLMKALGWMLFAGTLGVPAVVCFLGRNDEQFQLSKFWAGMLFGLASFVGIVGFYTC